MLRGVIQRERFRAVVKVSKLCCCRCLVKDLTSVATQKITAFFLLVLCGIGRKAGVTFKDYG